MIKASDYLIERLAKSYQVKHLFMVSGGGAMHLNDSIGKSKEIEYVCNHHEQACAIAAEGYSRVSGKLGVVNVTTGPGGTNALTGVIGQWLDSVPALYISGQVKISTTITACPELSLRQLGDQEINIVDIVKPVTKYAVMVTDARDIGYYLDKAVYLATHGRPGPVWIDIPLDIQSAMIDENDLRRYDPGEDAAAEEDDSEFARLIERTIIELKKSERPVFMVGQGVRISGGVSAFMQLAHALGIPVLTSICGHDVISSDDPLYCGVPGICGDRAGNFVAQNSDLMIIIGARLGIRQVTYNYTAFAEKAVKIMVDIDSNELLKPTLSIDVKIHADAKRFIIAMNDACAKTSVGKKEKWMTWCRTIQTALPTVHEDNTSNPGYVNLNVFIETLFKTLASDAVVVTGNGTAYTSTFQVMHVKEGMRVIANQGCASMGYDLPAAIGACYANNKRPVVALTGDGSIQMNIQELATISHNALPVKIFVLDNNGYLAIRTTQDSFFNGRHVASDPASGVGMPDLMKIANAYGIPCFEMRNSDSIMPAIVKTLEVSGPALCVVKMDPQQTLFPKVASMKLDDGRMISKPIDDMFPFISPELKQRYSYNA